MTVYELRTFVAAADCLETLVEQWERSYLTVYREFHDVVGAFVSHPERAEMPDGVALLLRHESLAAAQEVQDRLDASGRIGTGGDTDWAETTALVTRQILSPADFSALT